MHRWIILLSESIFYIFRDGWSKEHGWGVGGCCRAGWLFWCCGAPIIGGKLEGVHSVEREKDQEKRQKSKSHFSNQNEQFSIKKNNSHSNLHILKSKWPPGWPFDVVAPILWVERGVCVLLKEKRTEKRDKPSHWQFNQNEQFSLKFTHSQIKMTHLKSFLLFVWWRGT